MTLRRDLSIQARLGMLALVGTGSVVAVAITAVLVLGNLTHSGDLLTHDRTLLDRQQRVELHLLALDSDVRDAVRAAPSDQAAALSAVTISLERVEADALPAPAEAAAATTPGASLPPGLAEARQAVNTRALAAHALLTLVLADPAAAPAALTAYRDGAARARAAQSALTAELGRRVLARQARVDAAARSTTMRIWGSVAIGLLFPFVLCGLIARSVGASVRARGEAEAGLRAANSRLTADATRERFDATLKNAFEMAVSEDEAHTVVRRAVLHSAAGHRAELLLADNSQAHLSRVMTEPGGDAPGCGVLSPSDCIAVRRGRAAVFDSAEGIASCPKLAGRGEEIGQAACSPVTFLGAGLGVLHVVTRPGEQLSVDALRDLSVTAEQAGNRIGTLRAFNRSQLQAHTDGLTGLLNRRTVEERVALLTRTSRQLTLVLCDLDHFKKINDTFGHEAGDRALRVFSATLRSAVRADDLVARYGGEEFLLVLPDAGLPEAAATVERIQTALALALQAGGAPTFTASFGIAELQPGHGLDEGMRLADGALMRAKADGRDRVVLAGV